MARRPADRLLLLTGGVAAVLGMLGVATGRGLSVRAHGRPHPFYLALAGVEVGLGATFLLRRGRPR